MFWPKQGKNKDPVWYSKVVCVLAEFGLYRFCLFCIKVAFFSVLNLYIILLWSQEGRREGGCT